VSDPSMLTAEDERRYADLLPWYVNGTLSPADHAWMASVSKASPAAAAQLADQQAFCAAVRAVAPATFTASDPQRWMDLLGSNSTQLPTPGIGSLWMRALEGATQWLSRPRWAVAVLAVIVGQSAFIGWHAVQSDEAGISLKSTPALESRTLRVTFSSTATETQIRAALTAARARIVGGPTQFGEYWIASSAWTLDELKAAMQASGVVQSVEVDRAGPRGH
jgi:hypothetical protein